MSLLRSIGKKQIEVAQAWIGSGAVYGMASGCAVLYFTDWKTVLQYVPYYGGKWQK